MVVREMKCGMCGRRFEVEVLDREDPREKHLPGYPVRCPECRSTVVETGTRYPAGDATGLLTFKRWQ